jgi:hypothetical protein
MNQVSPDKFEVIPLGNSNNSNKFTKVAPEPSTDRKMAITDANHLANSIQNMLNNTQQKNDTILKIYKSTPAYDLGNSFKKTKIQFSGENSPLKRMGRFWHEPIVVVEQSGWERANYVFTGMLAILTVILFFYEKNNNLHLVPYEENIGADKICEEMNKLSEEEQKIKIEEQKIKNAKNAKLIDYYKNIKA